VFPTFTFPEIQPSQAMSLGITLSKDYKGPMEIAGYMRKVKSQYSLGKMLSSFNKRYFVLDLHYMQLYYLPKKESHYTDSQQIFLGEICKVTYDFHQVLSDDQVWKYGIIISARKKDYHLHSSSKEFIETLLFAFSHLIEYSTREPLFNWEAYQKQIKKSEVQQFTFSPQGTISLHQQNEEVLPSTPIPIPTPTSADFVVKKNDDSKKSLIEESQSPRASDKTSAPSSQTEAQEDETNTHPPENNKTETHPQIQPPEISRILESVQVLKVDSTTPGTRKEINITRMRAASRNRGRNNSLAISNNQQIANFIQNELTQTQDTKNSDFVGIYQADLSHIKPKEKTNNIWENPTNTNARSRYPSLEARQRNKAAHHHRAKLISLRGNGINIESPELSKHSNNADRQISKTPETNNSSPPKSSCDEDNQIPSNNEDWDKELFEDDYKKKKPITRANPESYNFRPTVPVHNDWDDELDL